MAQIPSFMKALVKKEEGPSYSYTDMAVPEPGPGEVLIKVDSVGICGSDIALYNWDAKAKTFASVPFIPGHECAGTVVKRGENTSIAIGSKVGVENHFYCGECYQCKHENGAICMNLGQYAFGRKTKQGGCSEYSVVPEKYLYKLNRDLDSEEIALLEPLGVAHNAIERLNVNDQDVLVIGCGPIGLLTQAVAKVLGAKRVIGIDVEDKKLELAKTMGTDITVNTKDNNLKDFVMDLTNGVGMDRICECSGASVMVNSCFSLLRKGGHVCLVGVPSQPLHIENVLPDIVFKALTLKTVHGRLIFHTWEETERLVADKHIDVKKVISHRFPMSQFEEAFKVLIRGEACKVLMDVSK